MIDSLCCSYSRCRMYYHRNPCVFLPTTVVGKRCWHNAASAATPTNWIRHMWQAHELCIISINAPGPIYAATMMTNFWMLLDHHKALYCQWVRILRFDILIFHLKKIARFELICNQKFSFLRHSQVICRSSTAIHMQVIYSFDVLVHFDVLFSCCLVINLPPTFSFKWNFPLFATNWLTISVLCFLFSMQLLGSITLRAWAMRIYQMRTCYANDCKCTMQPVTNRSAMAAIQVVRRVLAVARAHFVQPPTVQRRQTTHLVRVRFHIQHQIYPWDRQYIRHPIYCLISIRMVSIHRIICHCCTIQRRRPPWIIPIWISICSMLNWRWPLSIPHSSVTIQVIRKCHHCTLSRVITTTIQSRRAAVAYYRQIIALHRTIFRHRVLGRHSMRSLRQKRVRVV